LFLVGLFKKFIIVPIGLPIILLDRSPPLVVVEAFSLCLPTLVVHILSYVLDPIFLLQVVHPANLCFKLPDNVSLEEGAMCEPLSVGVHACRRANVSPETNVLIIGSGPIGLVTLLAARAFGAPRIVIADVDECRLSIAKDLGVDETIQVSTNIQVPFFHFIFSFIPTIPLNHLRP
jgi:D-arabinose 1-dehydrogenase-like Zn-dependent alcohol dehydrogenase